MSTDGTPGEERERAAARSGSGSVQNAPGVGGRLRRWWLDRPLRVKGLALVAIPVVPLVLLSLVYFPAEQRSLAIQDELHHALAVGQRSQQLIITIQEVRTAARQYPLTGDPDWRRSFRDAEARVPEALDRLEASLRSNSEDRRRMGRLRTLVAHKMEHLEAGLEDDAAAGRLTEAEAVLDSIRVVMDPFRTRADSVLARAAADGPVVSRLPSILVATASLLGILGGVAGVLLFTSGISDRIVTLERNTRRLGRPGRALIPMEASRGEIGRLSQGVEHADRTLKRRQEELRRARGEAEAATRTKSAFLAAMSHELRTPLGAVIGFAELLEENVAGELNDRQTRYVENILSSGRHLLELINDVLDLSKVEAGKMDLQLEKVDPLAVLESSIHIVEGAARRKDIRVEIETPARLPEMLLDEGRLKQILYNLLSNAVKFTEPGGRVTLGASMVDRDGGAPEGDDPDEASHLEIQVRDTGIGIAQDDLDRIFSEFEQVDSSLARTEQGTGLGLTLVRRLVALHGGEVLVDSSPGEGSTFTVRLPVSGPDAARGDPTAMDDLRDGAPKLPGLAEGAPTILVVEDDMWARHLLCETLNEAGYRTLTAGSGDEALSLARSESPHAITMDVLLPGRDGWEILADLKADPETRAIPVFLVTVVDDAERGRQLGAVAYFQKPVDRRGLLSAILAAAPLKAQGPLRVLVVDDDAAARKLARRAAEAEGHVVLEARGGVEGIEIARSERPDVIVLDLLMPDLTGFDVAAVLRDDPATADIPILVWTAQEPAPADRERLNRRIQAVSVKAGTERFIHALQGMLEAEAVAPGAS